MQNIENIIREAKGYLRQIEKGKYTAEPMVHALEDSVRELIMYIEECIEDDMK
jgi:hypothetical protein